MPEISRFFGIVIQMYFSDHQTPHFHARYGGKRAVVQIRTLKAMSNLSPRVLGFVVEWARLHRQELLENWERARRGEMLLEIEPLE